MDESPIETSRSLKAVCSRKSMYDAVQTVMHAVSTRSPLPILSHVLVQSEENALRLSATDMELGISCRIPALIEEPGGLTSQVKLLAQVFANLPDKADVAISVDKAHAVRVRCDRSDYKLLGLPAEEYPRLPEVRNTTGFTVPAVRLREMIRHVLFAVSQDEARPILLGVLLDFEGDTLRMVATDTHRLALKTAPVNNATGSQQVIVPARAMNELNRLLTDIQDEVQILMSENQIQFSLPGVEDIRIVARLIDGMFPAYKRVIPTPGTKQLTIPRIPLLQAVRRASIVAKENAQRIILRIEPDKMTITAESQLVGAAYEEVETAGETDCTEIAFNAKYLLDVLNVLEEDGIRMDLTESLKPGVVRPIPSEIKEGETAAESDYLCVLMPMQIV